MKAKFVRESLNEDIGVENMFPPGLRGKPNAKQQKARDAAREQLREMIEGENGWIYLSMVHYMYGPLKGTIRLIRAGDVGMDELLDFIEETGDPINASPKIQQFVYDIYQNIGLMPVCQIMPKEHLQDKNSQYPQVSSIDEYMKEVVREVIQNNNDPYYHRLGQY